MIGAAIFDMDGVVAHTERLHAQVKTVLLAARGIRIAPAELSRRHAGLADRDFYPRVSADHGTTRRCAGRHRGEVATHGRAARGRHRRHARRRAPPRPDPRNGPDPPADLVVTSLEALTPRILATLA